MKTIITILFFALNTNLYASYSRFWVGCKKEGVSTPAFLNGLNQIFFKSTIDVGQGRGLLSYQPYVTQMKSNVPDELALVIYESEEKYKAIRKTPEGERYSVLHWDFFEKETSKSTVAIPFKGELAEGSAFELHPSFKSWQSVSTTVVIYSRATDTNLALLAKKFEELKSNSEIENSILLVTDKWIVEYRMMKNSKSKLIKLPLKVIEMNQLQSSTIESLGKSVGFGEGVNFKF